MSDPGLFIMEVEALERAAMHRNAVQQAYHTEERILKRELEIEIEIAERKKENEKKEFEKKVASEHNHQQQQQQQQIRSGIVRNSQRSEDGDSVRGEEEDIR
jgi:hypothetical protein